MRFFRGSGFVLSLVIGLTLSASMAYAVQQYGLVAVDSTGAPISVLPDGGHGFLLPNQLASQGQLDAGLASCIATAAAGFSSGLSTNSTIILPVQLGRTDAGSVGTFQILTNGSDYVGLGALNALLIKPTGSAGGVQTGAVTIRNATNIDRAFSVESPDGGLLFSVFSDTILSPSVGEFGDPVNPRDAVPLGRLDAGVWGTIPGKASGLAANSTITGPVSIVGGGSRSMSWKHEDGGTYATMSGAGDFVAPTGLFGDATFGSFPDNVATFVGTTYLFAPVTYSDQTLGTVHAALYLDGSNILTVFDGSNPFTGGNPAELHVADATLAIHAMTLGQFQSAVSTLFSASPNGLLVDNVAIGGFKNGSEEMTVTAVSMYKSVAGVGSGSVVMRVTDGTNICDAPILCAGTGPDRGVAAATAFSCKFAAGRLLTLKPFGVSGTCTPLPTVLNVDVVAHR